MSEPRAANESPTRLSPAEDDDATSDDERGADVGSGPRTLAGDLRRLEDEARRLFGIADEMVRDQVSEAPLVCVGIAFGAGVVLGGGISRRTASALVALGGRAAVDHLRSTLFASGDGSDRAEDDETGSDPPEETT
ncbi:MAG: hypothetical protein R3F35_23730 [Myxococcota bacterium]